MDEKLWWKSRGVWGGVVAMVAGIAAALGYGLSEGVQNDLVELIVGIAGVAGGGLAVWGRIRAETKVRHSVSPSGLKSLLLLAVAVPVLLLAGCAGTRIQNNPDADTSRYQAIAAQLPGVVTALADVALTAPVDAQTRMQIEQYAALARVAAEAVASVDTASPEVADKLRDVVTRIADIVEASPADAQTRAQVANYAAWASFAIRIASLIGAMV